MLMTMVMIMKTLMAEIMIMIQNMNSTMLMSEFSEPSEVAITGPGCLICQSLVAMQVIGTNTNPYIPNAENVSLVSIPSGCDLLPKTK